MFVALSQKQEKNQYGDSIDTLEQNYIRYFQQWGIVPLLIPNTLLDVNSYLDQFPIQAIILTGGNEVDPLSYGEPRTEGMVVIPERDRTERALIEYAIEKKIPLLGICRGMQFINVFFGGKLINIKQKLGDIHPPRKNHPLHITEKNFSFLGKTAEVNSYHTYGLTQQELAPPLHSFALCGALIEGIYHPTLPIIGIIWHPERVSPDETFNTKLMQAFVQKEIF